MAHGDDIFNQVDALIQRHRSFVAKTTPDADKPVIEVAPTDEDDFPLLTDIVAAPLCSTSPQELDLAEQINVLVAEWLARMLPMHIEKVAAQIGAQLQASLAEEAQATLLPRLQGLMKTTRTVE
jgi:hypothetical protein